MIIEYERKSDYVRLSECDTGDVVEVYGDVYIITEEMNRDNSSTYLVRLKDGAVVLSPNDCEIYVQKLNAKIVITD